MNTNKGISETISTILIMLVVVIVVGIIIGGVLPEISKSQEKINYDNSIEVRDKIYSGIQEIYGSPIGATKEIEFSLANLNLDINSTEEKVEICSIGKDLKFYDDGITRYQDNNKYTYREAQKLCAGFILDNIDLTRSININNQEYSRIVLTKITINQIQISIDNETDNSDSDINYIYTGD